MRSRMPVKIPQAKRQVHWQRTETVLAVKESHRGSLLKRVIFVVIFIDILFKHLYNASKEVIIHECCN